MSPTDTGSRRRAVESSTLGAGVALALALLVIVNYFGWKYHDRYDWTEERLYTLSEKSVNVLRGLERDVEAVVFLTPADELYDPVRELLARYDAESPRFTVRILDPEKNPAEAQTLADRYQLDQGDVVIFDRGDDRRVVESADLAEYDFSGLQFGQGPRMTAFRGEQVFTGAILELAEDRKPKIVFTSGHGELRIDDLSPAGLSDARDLLGRDNFVLEEWESLGAPRVPEGTDVVVAAGPTAGFVEPEVAGLREFLERGGRLLLLVDPTLGRDGTFTDTGLEELLESYGVALDRDVVIDPSNPLPFYGAETIFVDSFGDHPITRSLRQTQVPVILPLARSVREAAGAEDLEVEELLRSSADGWGEKNLTALARVEKDEDDLPGPVVVGLAVQVARGGEAETGLDAEGEGDSQELEPEAAAAAPRHDSRLVVLGDSDFATNGQIRNVGNAELLANALNWLVEREALVGIPPKQPEQVRLTLSRAELSKLTWLVLGVLPGLAVVAGVGVYLRRRR